MNMLKCMQKEKKHPYVVLDEVITTFYYVINRSTTKRLYMVL